MSENPISILLVDDDPDTQNIIQMIMAHHKFPLAIAPNAVNALNQLTTTRPDVVLLDIYLPDSHGYDALKAIRKATIEHPPKIVAITAFYTSEVEAEMRARGFDGYLRKPFSPMQLVPYLKNLVGTR